MTAHSPPACCDVFPPHVKHQKWALQQEVLSWVCNSSVCSASPRTWPVCSGRRVPSEFPWHLFLTCDCGCMPLYGQPYSCTEAGDNSPQWWCSTLWKPRDTCFCTHIETCKTAFKEGKKWSWRQSSKGHACSCSMEVRRLLGQDHVGGCHVSI